MPVKLVSDNERNRDVEIELGGRRFLMRPTYTAIEQIEFGTDCGLVRLLQRMTDGGLRISDLAVIIAAGLEAAGEPASREAIGSLLLQDGIEKVMEPVARFLMNALSGGSVKLPTDGDQ